LAAVFICVAVGGCSSGGSPSSVVPQSAYLNFRPVYCVAPNYVAPHSLNAVTTTASATTVVGATSTLASAGGVSQADCADPNLASIPSTVSTANDPAVVVLIPQYDHAVRYLLGPADMQGDAVSDASAVVAEGNGGFQVQITLTSSGAAEFDKIASQRYPHYAANPSNPPVESQEAIELNAVVLSAPVIQAEEFNGTVIISGSPSAPFTQAQADRFAKEIRLASNPAK
jgi:preprotein translocase subunit SecD